MLSKLLRLYPRVEQLRLLVDSLRRDWRKILKEMSVFFCLQVFSYGAVTFNYRVIAQGRTSAAVLSDMTIAAFNFFVIKKVAGSKSKVAAVGYVLGSMLGTSCGIWVTKLMYGD